MRDSRIRFIREQGFEGTAFPDSFYTALMFQPRGIAALAVLGAVAHSPWLFVVLAAVLWWSTAVPALNPFDAIYNHAVAYPRRLRPLGGAPAPRRFAQGLAGTVAGVVGVAFLMGATATGWVFAAVFILASMAAVLRDSCFGAHVYHQLRRWQARSSKHSLTNGAEGPLIQHRH